MRLTSLLVCLLAFANTLAASPCSNARDHSLPLPSTFVRNNDPAAFQKVIQQFLTEGEYEKLGWCVDKGVRDTGPYVNGAYYGTHPAVRVWYSPKMMTWLLGDRTKPIPDGAMMVKEQFKPPAARYAGMNDDQVRTAFAEFKDWTVMIRDSAGAKDGWFWTEIWDGMVLDSYGPPFAIFNADFGLYCYRCHASAEQELTFASTNNIRGLPGEPLTFRDDGSWRTPPSANVDTTPQNPETDSAVAKDLAAPNHPRTDRTDFGIELKSTRNTTGVFGDFFANLPPAIREPAPPQPGENYDHVVSRADGPQHFLTSDQCMGCHSGNSYGNVMLFTEKLLNLSPYGEWRWSPMGLAGRDPIFFAQFDSEMAYLDSRNDPARKAEVMNLCFTCHGVMGQRQLQLDHSGELFKREYVDLTDLKNPRFEYGALARDGVSCAACHHIRQPKDTSFEYFLEKSITGRFEIGKPEELAGPFDDVVETPMENALGITPKHDPYTQNARLCGTCHTIHLPVIDGKTNRGSLEQLTYLEWLNSAYQNELGKVDPKKAQTCQDCHMRGTYDGVPLQGQIAAVQDLSFPATEGRAPGAEVDVKFRTTGYRRHQLQGLNVFLLEMFNQFSDLLGVRKCDYMRSGCNDKAPISNIPTVVDNFVKVARTETATIALAAPKVSGNTLTADVTVTNLVGHRMPSGVGFRRAFIELTVADASGAIVWGSGRTNAAGLIVDNDGRVLDSEYVGTKGPRGNSYQPHFYAPAKPITRSDQVQIYEELVKDSTGAFTTSFIRRDEEVKDNRLLPLGWTLNGPDPAQFKGEYLKATRPTGVGKDPRYTDGSGSSVVRYAVPLPRGTNAAGLKVTARLYYQSIPPYYLLQRFEAAPSAPATRRLYQIVTNLDTSKTPFPNWKLLIAETSR